VDELIVLYNTVDALFRGRCTTFINYGFSAGAMAFLLGDQRIAYEYSSSMFHSYSGGFFGKRDDLLTQMKHEDKKLTRFFRDLVRPYFSKKDIDKVNKGKDYWMETLEMCKKNIVTHVITGSEMITAKEYIKLKKKSNHKPKKKKKNKPKNKKPEGLK
jgi:ATP-dependent protease ClpP protease subunit